MGIQMHSASPRDVGTGYSLPNVPWHGSTLLEGSTTYATIVFVAALGILVILLGLMGIGITILTIVAVSGGRRGGSPRYYEAPGMIIGTIIFGKAPVTDGALWNSIA